MRCRACDITLTDYESTRKSVQTNEYVDLCNDCYKHIKDDVQVIDNADNINIQDVIDFEDDPW